MAEFSANLNPANTNQMSLGDMLKMSYYSSQASIASAEASREKEKIKELLPVQAFMANPDNYSTDGKLDPDKAAPALMAIAPLTGPAHIEKLQTLATNQTNITDAKMNLTGKERTLFAQVDGAYGQAKVKDPNAYIQAYQRIASEYAFNPDVAKLANAKISNVQLAGGGDHLWQQALRQSNEMMTLPEQQASFAPKAGTAIVGGATVQTTTQPSIEGRPPTISTSQLGGGTTLPIKPIDKKLPDIIQEDPGFNYTGPTNPRNLDKFQEEAYKSGKESLRNVPGNVQAAEEGLQYVRKVNDVAYKASGAGLFKTAQDWAKLIVAQPDLDILRKNIAGVMVQNANIMGLNATDKSRGDAATISGSDAISPEALRDIMQRAEAQFSATAKFGKAADNYVGKRGEINSAINFERFQRKWATNYDSRIFQMDAIKDSNYPEKVKKEKYAKVRESMSEDEFDKLDRKAEIIHRMIGGAYQ